MIRRSPAEYYIKYLLLHPDRYDDEDIKRILSEHQLDNPGGDYIQRLRNRLSPPRPFYPMNDTHHASFRYLVIEKVHKMFYPDSKTEAALTILNTPRLKEVVESMAIVGDAPALTASRVRRMGLGQLQTGDLIRYHHFFFNVLLVDPTELRALMKKRVEDMAIEDPNNPQSVINYRAMRQSMYADARYIAAHDPCPVLSAQRLQIRFGFMPDRVDTARVAELGAHLAAMGAAGAGMIGGPKAPQDMRDYGIAAKQLQDLRDALGAPNEAVRKDLQAIAIQTAQASDVRHIDELTEGDYSDGFILTEGESVEK